MKQRPLSAMQAGPQPSRKADGIHVGIIMDGNGRWATTRGLPRLAGHHAGAKSVRRAVEAAPDLGIATLTLFAFSSDNWKRPPAEVRGLMRLFRSYLRSEVAELRANGVRLSGIGRRDRLPGSVVREMERAEAATGEGTRLHLRIAVDYSARDAIVEAARRTPVAGGGSREEFARLLGEAMNLEGASPDLDLLIRTGGEQRLSDFLLWECAYAEFVFTPRLWPDFDAADLEAAIVDFCGRERRFGAVPEDKQEPSQRHRETEEIRQNGEDLPLGEMDGTPQVAERWLW
jgi:undecaprenyl diphosphate synthase